MDFLFGRKSPAEILKQNQRALTKAQRDLDRERVKLEQQEKKLIADIKKNAKQGQMVCFQFKTHGKYWGLKKVKNRIHYFSLERKLYGKLWFSNRVLNRVRARSWQKISSELEGTFRNSTKPERKCRQSLFKYKFVFVASLKQLFVDF